MCKTGITTLSLILILLLNLSPGLGLEDGVSGGMELKSCYLHH